MTSLPNSGRKPLTETAAPPAPRSPRPSGLRERKKARTRSAIQREALRLFRTRGYHVTTVEQIAEAAEVAPSTVFRYFATKEDLVRLDDDYVELRNAFQAQPPGLSPTQALRRAFRAVFAGQTAQELRENLEREMVVLSVPELWAANFTNITGILPKLAALLAERTDRGPDDPELRTLSGAVCGVVLTVWLDWAKDPSLDGPAALDEALAHLEAGLPVGRGVIEPPNPAGPRA
ncbi:TetR/AcrR family transcriptional regulator [Streptomyces sp. NPDC003006]